MTVKTINPLTASRYLVMAVLAAVLLFASCQKEMNDQPDLTTKTGSDGPDNTDFRTAALQMIYGISDEMQHDPLSDLFDSHMDGLTEGQVAQLKDIPPGGGVSYGHRFVAMRQSRIAAIPVGYADGYNRLLTNRGDVLIHGCRAPIAGTVMK